MLLKNTHTFDLDAFLFVLLQQFHSGDSVLLSWRGNCLSVSLGMCPVDPLHWPRRHTDGSLPNFLNFDPSVADVTSPLIHPRDISTTLRSLRDT